MNLDKDISSWAKVQPDSVMSMSGAAQKNVLTMALHDIAILGVENERLRTALAAISEMHCGDQPAASGHSDEIWKSLHIGKMRAAALAALK
jgi:hypothetical protein